MIGWLLGVMLISAAVFVYIKKHKFGLGGVFLSSIGLVLVGLAFWQTISLKGSKNGEFTISFEMKKNIDSLVNNDKKINQLVAALIGKADGKVDNRVLQSSTVDKVAEKQKKESENTESEIERNVLLSKSLPKSINYNNAINLCREECMTQVPNSKITKLSDKSFLYDSREVTDFTINPLQNILTLLEMELQRGKSRELRSYLEEQSRLVETLKANGFGDGEN